MSSSHLPPPKTCRYPNCTNALPGGPGARNDVFFCQELHAAENITTRDTPKTLVPGLQNAPIVFARPKFLRFLKSEVDAKVLENLTGYPQLPDPFAKNARLPREFVNRLRALEEEHELLTPDQPPSIDLQLLREMKASYNRAHKIQDQDLSTLEQRDRVNAFCRDTLLKEDDDDNVV